MRTIQAVAHPLAGYPMSDSIQLINPVIPSSSRSVVGRETDNLAPLIKKNYIEKTSKMSRKGLESRLRLTEGRVQKGMWCHTWKGASAGLDYYRTWTTPPTSYLSKTLLTFVLCSETSFFHFDIISNSRHHRWPDFWTQCPTLKT